MTTSPSAGPALRIPPARVAVSFSAAGAAPAYRVEAPERVLRLWSLLNAAAGDFRADQLSAPARGRLQRVLTGVSAELGQCVTPALAAELRDLLGSGEAAPSAAELRIEYAAVLGWLGGLVVVMLDELEGAARTGPGGAAGSRLELAGSVLRGHEEPVGSPLLSR